MYHFSILTLNKNLSFSCLLILILTMNLIYHQLSTLKHKGASFLWQGSALLLYRCSRGVPTRIRLQKEKSENSIKIGILITSYLRQQFLLSLKKLVKAGLFRHSMILLVNWTFETKIFKEPRDFST